MEEDESLTKIGSEPSMDCWTLLSDNSDQELIVTKVESKKNRRKRKANPQIISYPEKVKRKVNRANVDLGLPSPPAVNYIVNVEPEASGRDTLIRIVKLIEPIEEAAHDESSMVIDDAAKYEIDQEEFDDVSNDDDESNSLIYISKSPPSTPPLGLKLKKEALSLPPSKLKGKRKRSRVLHKLSSTKIGLNDYLESIPEQDQSGPVNESLQNHRDCESEDPAKIDNMELRMFPKRTQKRRRVIDSRKQMVEVESENRMVVLDIPDDLNTTESSEDAKTSKTSKNGMSDSSTMVADLDVKKQSKDADLAALPVTVEENHNTSSAKDDANSSVRQSMMRGEGTTKLVEVKCGKRMKVMCVCPCGMMFSHRSGLSRHRRIVHLGMTYRCPMCGEHFTRSDSLSDHIRRMNHGHGYTGSLQQKTPTSDKSPKPNDKVVGRLDPIKTIMVEQPDELNPSKAVRMVTNHKESPPLAGVGETMKLLSSVLSKPLNTSPDVKHINVAPGGGDGVKANTPTNEALKAMLQKAVLQNAAMQKATTQNAALQKATTQSTILQKATVQSTVLADSKLQRDISYVATSHSSLLERNTSQTSLIQNSKTPKVIMEHIKSLDPLLLKAGSHNSKVEHLDSHSSNGNSKQLTDTVVSKAPTIDVLKNKLQNPTPLNSNGQNVQVPPSVPACRQTGVTPPDVAANTSRSEQLRAMLQKASLSNVASLNAILQKAAIENSTAIKPVLHKTVLPNAAYQKAVLAHSTAMLRTAALQNVISQNTAMRDILRSAAMQNRVLRKLVEENPALEKTVSSWDMKSEKGAGLENTILTRSGNESKDTDTFQRKESPNELDEKVSSQNTALHEMVLQHIGIEQKSALHEAKFHNKPVKNVSLQDVALQEVVSQNLELLRAASKKSDLTNDVLHEVALQNITLQKITMQNSSLRLAVSQNIELQKALLHDGELRKAVSENQNLQGILSQNVVSQNAALHDLMDQHTTLSHRLECAVTPPLSTMVQGSQRPELMGPFDGLLLDPVAHNVTPLSETSLDAGIRNAVITTSPTVAKSQNNKSHAAIVSAENLTAKKETAVKSFTPVDSLLDMLPESPPLSQTLVLSPSLPLSVPPPKTMPLSPPLSQNSTLSEAASLEISADDDATQSVLELFI